MADVAELAVRIVADDQASAKLQAVQRQLTSSETSLKGLATTAGLSSAAVGTAFAGMATAAFKMGQEWDDALDKVRISTGATGEALDTLKADVSAVAREVPVSLGEVSGAMAELSRRTQLTGEPLQELTKQVIDFSRITGSDAVQNARLVTRAFGDWSIATEDQVGFLDKLLRASQATGVSVTTLQEGLVRYGAPLRQLGFDIDESVAILGKFEKEGVNAELVLGSLRIALGEMARQGVPAREGLNDVITAIKGAGDASEANKLAMEIFGARAGPDMAAAIREGRLEIGQLTKDIRDGGETVQQAAADTDDGAQKFAIAANKMKVAFEPVSAGMFTAASSGLESLSALGAGIDKFLAGSGKNMLEFRQAMAAGFALGPTGETAPDVPLKITVDEAASTAAIDDYMTSVVGLPSIHAGGEAVGTEFAEATGDGAEAAADTAMAPWLKKLIDKGKEGAFNLKEALRDAGTDETAIAGVLAFANEIGVIDKAISQLTDRTIAAHIIALRNDGEQAEAAAAAEAHLTAQAKSQADALNEGALAARTKAEADAQAKEQALGGAIAVRDHGEALAREHEAALGGALAIRAHEEALAQQKEQALGGALAIRDHEEALARDKEVNLGGALAIRDHTEQLQRDKDAALGGVAAIRDHEDALQREKTAALGGEVGIRAHAEALNEEKIAALGGALAIQAHEDALNRQKTAALGGELGIRAHAEALNEEKIAELGGRDAIALHAEALERLNDQVNVNIAARKAQIAAIKELSGAQRAAITATAGGTGELPLNSFGSRGIVQSPGTGSGAGSPSPFASTEFVAWYNATFPNRETEVQRQGSSRGEIDPTTITRWETVMERFNTRFMETWEQGTENLRTKIVDALSHAGETFAQRMTRTTGVPTSQTNLDNSTTQLARQALDTIERSMTLRRRADLEYTAELQGPVAALGTLGRSINENVTEEQAMAEATRGLTKATNSTGDAMLQGVSEIQAAWYKLGLTSDSLGQGMDYAGAAAARAGAATFDMSHSVTLAAAAAAAAAETFKAAAANAAALMAGAMRNAGVAGGVTQKGLTYTEIMGGQTPGSSTGISSLGSSPYGLPILSGSPITPGTLRGFAEGPYVPEPSYLTSIRTRQTYGVAGEHGPEPIGYGLGGGSPVIHLTINASGVDALRDQAFWDQAVARQIRPALQRVGAKV